METVQVNEADLTNGATGLQDKGGYTLEKKDFAKGSKSEGFSYYVIQYTNVQKLVEKIGEKAVLALANSAIVSSLRAKANAELSDDENEDIRKAANAELLAKTGGILVTEADAEAFVPGQREKTSVATLMKEAKAAKEAGNTDLARQLYKAAMEQLQARALADIGSLDEDATSAQS